MKLNEQQISILQEDLCFELVEILMDTWGYSADKALDVLYNSDTFSLLQDPSTGLYYQSAGYVYSYLEEELKTGRIA